MMALLAVLPAAAEEESWDHPKDKIRYDYYMEALKEALGEQGDVEVGSLTLNDLNDIASRLSISLQQGQYVERSKAASWFLPGAGQFMNDEVGLGVLFLSADVVIWAGAFIGAYFLLPADLQFGNLDYFGDDYSTIRGRWGAHSFIDYLPAMSVLAGGTVLSTIIRIISSGNAEELARERVESGAVTFEPLPFLLHIPTDGDRGRRKRWH
jgi:hypothetical protein